MKIIYLFFIIIALTGYFTLPALTVLMVKQNKTKYPTLYKQLYINDDTPFNLKDYIGIVNYILIGLLIAFLPVLNSFVVIITILSLFPFTRDNLLSLLEILIDTPD